MLITLARASRQGPCAHTPGASRLAPDGQVWLLEAIAYPFISIGHDFAESAEKSGLSYAALIQRLVDTAQERHGHTHA